MMLKRKKYNPEENAALVTLKLLDLLHVPFTGKFSRDIRLHPEYPSLLSISNALNELHVENAAVSISGDQLKEMCFPAIAQMHSSNGGFIIILKIENEEVHYLNGEMEKVQVTINDFIADWTGILLLAERNEKSGEPNYIENKKLETLSKLRYTALLFLLATMYSVLFFLKPDFVFPVLVQTLGLGLCLALLMQTLGQNTLLSDAVCESNSKIDCKHVVNSSAAKVYGDISLSEIGLLFFAGGLATNVLLLLGGYSVFNPYLLSLFMLSLPFTVFSIYYQWRVLKTWCSLCLAVMGLLWIGAIYYVLLFSSFHFEVVELLSAIVGFCLPLVIWFIVRPSIMRAQSVDSLRKSLYKFSKNKNVFDTLSQKQKQLIDGSFGSDVVLGSPEAKHTITLVTGPTCGPCVNAHQQVESWLDQFEDNLKVVVRFAINPMENGSVPNTVARNLISLALNSDYEKMKEAMANWYNPKRPDIKEWLSSLPSELHPRTEEHFNNHSYFFNRNNIRAVPAIFFDDRQIPKEYSFKDFENILRLKLNEGE